GRGTRGGPLMLRGPPLPPLKYATIGEALAAAAKASTATSTPTGTSTPARTATSTGTSTPTGLTFLDPSEHEHHFSFSDLHLRARRAAASLAALGIRPGDRVALVLPTGVEFMDAFFGSLLAGAIPVPLYPPVRLGRLGEFHARTARLLRACGARLLLTDAPVGRLLGQAAARARPGLGLHGVS